MEEVVVPQKRPLEEAVDLRSGLKIEEPEQERTDCKCLVQSMFCEAERTHLTQPKSLQVQGTNAEVKCEYFARHNP